MLEVKVSRNVKINNEEFPLVVETKHGPVIAMTAVHSHRHANRQGGVRFVRQGTHAELGHLARGMSEKCAASGVPLDGLKCLVVCPEGEPETYEEKAAILSAHFLAVISEDNSVIFGPDMGCPEEVLSLVAERSGLLPHVTGLTAEWGGLEIDKRGYTAFGLVEAIEAAGVVFESMTFSIQGFGAVGANAARLIAERGGRLRAVSNKNGMLVADRLDIDLLFRLWKQSGDQCLESFVAESTSATVFSSCPEDIFAEEADVFIPAARTSVLAMPEELLRIRLENPEAHNVREFLGKTGVKLVAEGANHPLTESAESYLEEHGVRILPDVLVNCGGMIGCRLEWTHRAALMARPELTFDVDQQCRSEIQQIIKRNVSEVFRSTCSARKTADRIVNR